MPWGVAAAVAGAAISGSMQADAAGEAADQQAESSRASDATQRYFYDTSRADNMPFLQAGYQANDLIRALLTNGGASAPSADYASFRSDPYYQFLQDEGSGAVERSAAARGGLYSGATLKALQNRGQQTANGYFGEWWNRQDQGKTNALNRLLAVRNGGQAATSQIGSAGQNAANTISSNQTALGNAQGASTLAQGNSWANAFNQGASALGGYFGQPAGGVGQTSTFGNNKGAFSNMLNGYSNDDVYWN